MLSSQTAGTPSGNRALKPYSSVPGETSVTEPLMSTPLPIGTPMFGAVTVV